MNHNWQHNWYYVATESEIPSPGDFKTLVIGEQPVIVVRGEDGQIRVLFNICRHRDVTVCHEKRGHATRFVCLFHGWIYNTKGNLIGLTGVENTTRTFRERRGLTPAPRVESVHNCIFASLNADGEDLATYLRKTKFFDGQKTKT